MNKRRARCISTVVVGLCSTLAKADALGAVEALVAWHFPLPQIRPRDLAAILAGAGALLFDVRTAEEFAVSHLPGAIRVEPHRDAAAFIYDNHDALRSRTVVFYCTVGARSSRLAKAVLAHIEANEGAKIFNLLGGIFRWQAVGLPLETSDGPTDIVHPCNAFWARLAPHRAPLGHHPPRRSTEPPP